MSTKINITNMTTMQSAVQEISRAKERLLLEQLGELVSRGLLVVEYGETTLVAEADGSFRLLDTVKLLPKEKEYIEKLEAKVKELGERLSAIQTALEPINATKPAKVAGAFGVGAFGK